MFGVKFIRESHKLPKQPEEILNLHPHILCLAVNKNEWATLKGNAYANADAGIDLMVPIFGQDEVDSFSPSGKWCGKCAIFGENVWDLVTENTEHKYCTKKLTELHIVTPQEFEKLWNQILSAGNQTERMVKVVVTIITVSAVLRDSYKIVYFTAAVQFVENMASWTRETIQFHQLTGLLKYISQHVIFNMQKEIIKSQELRNNYLPFFKRWIAAVDTLYDIYPGISLGFVSPRGILNQLKPMEGLVQSEDFLQSKDFLPKEMVQLKKLLKENDYRILVKTRIETLLQMIYTDADVFSNSNIRGYLHFDLHGTRDYYLIFQMTQEFLTSPKLWAAMQPKDRIEKQGRMAVNVLRLAPALPFVLLNEFPRICPQAISIDRNNIVFKVLAEVVTKCMHVYSDHGLDLYMAALVLREARRHPEISVNVYENQIPYLQPDKDLCDNAVAGLYMQDIRITADDFYKQLFNDELKVKFLQGERLFALTDHLRFDEDIQDAFPGYMEKACELFLEDTNSTLDFGCLLIYFKVLEQFMTPSHIKIMEDKLKERQEAERILVSFFIDPKQVSTSNFRSCIENFPYVFFLAFIKVFLFHTQNDMKEEQQDLIKRFVDTLEFSPNLKQLLNRQKIARDIYFHEFLYKKLTTSTKSGPLDQLKNLCSSDWGNVLAGASAVRFKSYEKTSLVFDPNLHIESGQAYVDLVTVPGLPVQVIAKTFTLNNRATPDGQHEAFMQMKGEIRSLLTTQCNPHIVSLYGYIVDEHLIAGLLMEYCKGGSLDKVITSDTVTYDEASIVRWSLQAACGLQFIHESKAIHRDVKPHNMLLNDDHQLLKISDLGFTRLGKIASNVLCCDFTSERGTDGYTANEILDGDDSYTPKVDVFGLGRSIWSMIFRCNPKEPLDEKLTAKVDVSSEIKSFIKRMMEHDSELRPTMKEVYNFFEKQRNLESHHIFSFGRVRIRARRSSW